MRHILIFTAALIMINTAPRAQTLDAGPILAAARTALGGDKKLAAIKSFKAGGHLTRLIGNVQLAGDVELSCELPDRYVRKETLSFGSGSATTAIGFNGSGVITETVNAPMADGGDGRSVRVFLGPGTSQPGTTAEQKAEARGRALASAKQDFIRVTLGPSCRANRPFRSPRSGQASSTPRTSWRRRRPAAWPNRFSVRMFGST